jgi:hypothetical protein
VARQEDHLTGQVELIDEHGLQIGLREFSVAPDRCDDLVRAMALTIVTAPSANGGPSDGTHLPVDCGKLSLCYPQFSPCVCNSTRCDSGQGSDVRQFDLRFSGDTAEGLSGDTTGRVHFTRAQ